MEIAQAARWSPSAPAAHRRRAPAHSRNPRSPRRADWTACPVPRCSFCSTNCTPVEATAARTRSASCPITAKMCSGATTRLAAAITCASSGLPPIWCSTLGRFDFNRVPLPAAMITTASSRCLSSALRSFLFLRRTPAAQPCAVSRSCSQLSGFGAQAFQHGTDYISFKASARACARQSPARWVIWWS